VEVVDACLERIQRLNEELNLFCFVYADEARAAARAAESAVARGADLGPLAGVPYALKDFTPTKGRITTLGSRLFRDWAPDFDPPVVERLRRAGGILVGKTTTPEFAHSGFTSSPLWGISRNPWDPTRTPGGSSGGSAGAVAAGMVPLAEGSDAGGSIRIPASFCGVVGFKPSHGRVPMHVTANDFEQIFHLGPLARTVADCALMFFVMEGPDERDPLSLVPGLAESRPTDPPVAGLRLGLSVDLGYYDIAPEVEANTRAAAAAFAELGAEVTEVDLGWNKDINRAWLDYWSVAIAALYGERAEGAWELVDPEVRALIERGRSLGAVELKRIEQLRTRQWAAIRPVLQTHDALLCPTTSVEAPAAEQKELSYRRAAAPGRFGGYELTCPFNFIAQCPVISVPSGLTSQGLPTGLQIVGRRYDDVTVLGLAAALERARPWDHFYPPRR
jgi:Asp-tRNA(Asn)/Glu-tRNA(Gln) amidotransferase A subunit family amidase